MGTSVTMKLLAAALVAMVVLLGTGADAALRVRNDMNSTITVSHPPSCTPCEPGKVCGPACIVGFDLESGKEDSLNPNVPYPLAYLKVQVQGEDQVYCVPATDLKYLTTTALLEVGPGECAQGLPNTILGVIVDHSGRRSTCLQLCSA